MIANAGGIGLREGLAFVERCRIRHADSCNCGCEFLRVERVGIAAPGMVFVTSGPGPGVEPDRRS